MPAVPPQTELESSAAAPASPSPGWTHHHRWGWCGWGFDPATGARRLFVLSITTVRGDAIADRRRLQDQVGAMEQLLEAYRHEAERFRDSLARARDKIRGMVR